MTVFLVLQIFFEGVQECIAAGVKEDEVGYQIAFSKQELRKCIKEYPAKELKKGLEQLYKKVEKHLCEEENLLQVLYRSCKVNLSGFYALFMRVLFTLGVVDRETYAFPRLPILKVSHRSAHSMP